MGNNKLYDQEIKLYMYRKSTRSVSSYFGNICACGGGQTACVPQCMCHSVSVEVRKQPSGGSSLSQPLGSGDQTEVSRRLHPLSHPVSRPGVGVGLGLGFTTELQFQPTREPPSSFCPTD